MTPQSLNGSALPPPERWALFLDIDGTMLDIAPQPDAVVVPADLKITLPALSQRLGGAVAIVTGRDIATADRLFAPIRLAISGQHGAELRAGPSDPVRALRDPGPIAAIGKRLQALAREFPGVRIEEKGLSVGVHFRHAPDAAQAVRAAVCAEERASDDTLEAIQGKMVWDLRPRGLNKGTAVATLMTEPLFAGRIPVVLGDDRTDEDGFGAAAGLRGFGILVGAKRATAAKFLLPTPQACRDWLAEIAGAL